MHLAVGCHLKYVHLNAGRGSVDGHAVPDDKAGFIRQGAQASHLQSDYAGYG
jgi:hypothetical protein